MTWNPSLYMTFGDERTRPAIELLARISTTEPERVADLGCGPGNSTGALRARWPAAEIDGVDSSAEMLDKARQSGVAARWIEADLATWLPDEPYDVIFSNATFQWLGHHSVLLPRLMGLVKKGGVLGFQVPHNMQAPSHALMREAAASGPWATKLKDVREVDVLSAASYYDILKPEAVAVDVWESEYLHVLTGPDAVFHWVSATGLRPFVQALEGDERAVFIADYQRRLNVAYPRRPDGTTLLGFKRLFAVAHL